jgi:quercetin dioxygenase-like cupin family protein
MRAKVALAVIVLGAMAVGMRAERQAPQASRIFESPRGTTLKVLLDHAGLGGGEVEIGELNFPPNSDSGDHQHAVAEVFYVLEGELEHVVDGRSVKLSAGMIGSVRPPSSVRHKTGPTGAKALVIWAPGGEIARVTARWRAK